MFKSGDIVLIKSHDHSIKNENSGVILGMGADTSEFLIAFSTKPDNIKTIKNSQFMEKIIPSETENSNLENVMHLSLNKLSTVNTKSLEYLDTVKKSKMDKILRTFAHYSSYLHYNFSSSEPSSLNYLAPSGKVLDQKELFNMVDSSLDMWLTSGRFDEKFRTKLGEFLGINYVLTVNSGSSANLLAISALKSSKLENKKLCDGDEVITVAACFPTTVSPIIQNNLIPVFVDVELGSYNIDYNQIEKAISPKTKAIFVAHTLGNPFNIDKVVELAEKYDLWIIEDNCDALGSEYDSKYTGTYGHISTFSFYPAHHITMGEGGAIATNDSLLYKILLSLRDWGRDCYCAPGEDNTCNMRFSRKLGNLPFGYDHKYVYSHIGYNLKITDWQAAIALAQLEKLPDFIENRKINFKSLKDGLKSFEEFFILPEKSDKSDPSWFGFPITIRNNEIFTKLEIVTYLEENNIGTRQLFSGNILRQPLFLDNDIPIRIIDEELIYSSKLKDHHYEQLPNTEKIMNDTFWIGLWPGISDQDIEYMIHTFKEFLVKKI